MRPVGAKLFLADGRTDRQTDITKLIFAVGKICKTRLNTHIFYLHFYGFLSNKREKGPHIVTVPKLITHSSFSVFP